MTALRHSLLALLVLVPVGAGAGCAEEGPDESGPGVTSHNAGSDCLDCHALEFAGTIYRDTTGLEPATGAEIVITSPDGESFSIIADDTGSFYTTRGNASQGYVVHVVGGKGMMNPAEYGGCNRSACHDGSSEHPHVTLQ